MKQALGFLVRRVFRAVDRWSAGSRRNPLNVICSKTSGFSREGFTKIEFHFVNIRLTPFHWFDDLPNLRQLSSTIENNQFERRSARNSYSRGLCSIALHCGHSCPLLNTLTQNLKTLRITCG